MHKWLLCSALSALCGTSLAQGTETAIANTPPQTTLSSTSSSVQDMTLPASVQATIDRLMQPYDGDVPGASLLVLKDDKPIVRRSYGLSDLEKNIESSPATNYRLASVSKQFTAAAVLLLAQSGKLTVNDPVQKWLPSLPPITANMTLHHLLEHTSGVLDYEDLMEKPYDGQISDAGVLALLEKQNQLNFPPGSRYRYSNSGYALLALVVERASGQRFPEFLRDHIFRPLGMDNTLAYVVNGPAVPHRAWGYSEQNSHWQRTDQNAYSAVLGDGGIYSNSDDLTKWDAALNDNRLFSEDTLAQVFAKHVEVIDGQETSYYGYGWRISNDGSRQWHSGESIGFRNTLIRWPNQRLTVIVLSNRNAPTPYQIAFEIGTAILQATAEP